MFQSIKIEIIALVVLLIGFVTTYIIIPKLIIIIRHTNLMDQPDERSSHTEKTPTLGGVSFYISLIFGLFTIHYFDYDGASLNVIVGLTILFFIGLKDDLMVLSPYTKLWAQFIALSFVLVLPDLYLTSFNGFLGIEQIPAYIGILLSYFIMVFIVNAYNLIDGIDGLSGMLGIWIFIVFGSFFYFLDHYFYFLLSILGVGFLLSYLRFNLSQKHKIFMGDTGSLMVGFLIAILTVRFLAMREFEYEKLMINSGYKFLIVISILFFPIVDIARVIIMRLLNGNGPFEADRRHMHHILVDKGLQHKVASVTITICGLIIFSILYVLNLRLSPLIFIIVFLSLTLMTFTILLLLDSDKHATTYRKKFKAIFPRSFQIIEFRVRKMIIFVMKKLFYKDLL